MKIVYNKDIYTINKILYRSFNPSVPSDESDLIYKVYIETPNFIFYDVYQKFSIFENITNEEIKNESQFDKELIRYTSMLRNIYHSYDEAKKSIEELEDIEKRAIINKLKDFLFKEIGFEDNIDIEPPLFEFFYEDSNEVNVDVASTEENQEILEKNKKLLREKGINYRFIND